MLVLSRKLNERIVIDGNIQITVVAIRGGQVRIGIEAPQWVKIQRAELLDPDRVRAKHAESLDLAVHGTAVAG